MTINTPNRHTPGTKQFFYGYVIVAIAFLMMVMTLGAYFTVGVFFKPLITELGWSRSLISGAVSTIWIVSGFLSIIVGRLIDRFGPRVIVTICVLLSGMGYLLMSQVSAVWQLYLFYGGLIGIGFCLYVPLSATVVRWFVKRRTLMIGIVLTGVGLGMLVAPPIANQLILAYGWRLSYIIIGSIYLIVSLVASQFLKRDPAAIGQIAYSASEMPGDINYSQARSFLVKEVVSTKQFWILVVVQICAGMSIHNIMVHIAPHVTDLGISATSAANTLAIIGIATIVSRVLLGIAGDRMGNRKVFAVSFLLLFISYLWLLVSKDIWQFYIFAAIFGIGFGGCVTQAAPLVAALFGLSSYGVTLALISLGFTIGAAIGPALDGLQLLALCWWYC
jgi:MFS family permease